MEAPEPRFGSDRMGALYGYRFSPGSSAALIPPTTEVDLDVEAGEGEFVWLHFNLANQAALRWLSGQTAIPKSLLSSLNSPRLPHLEADATCFVATMSDLTLVDADEVKVSSLVACLGPSFLITGRRIPLQCVDRLRTKVLQGRTYSSPAGLFAALLAERAAVLEDLLRPAAEQVDAIEDRLIGGYVTSSRATLGVLRRTLVRVHRLLVSEPHAFANALARRPAWLPEQEAASVSESVERLTRAIVDCHSLVDRIKVLQEEVFAVVSEETNRTLFTLTVVTVLALPMTIASGFYGMNFSHMPLQSHPAGFWLVVACTCGISGFGAWMLFRSYGK